MPLYPLGTLERPIRIPIMALDITGAWSAGDDLRIIKVLLLPFGTYTLECTQNCMNQLEDMSPEAALDVVSLLDAYDASQQAESNANAGDTEGKVLVKADVLEWEVTGVGQPTGPQQEMNRIRMEISNYFAFCSCMGNANGGHTGYGYATTSLIRS